MQEQNTDVLKDTILPLLPIYTLLILMYGAAKQFIYYYEFNLDIFSFLEISELLPQSLFDLFIGGIYNLAGVLVGAYYLHKVTPSKKKIVKPTSTALIVDESVRKAISEERHSIQIANAKELRKDLPKILLTFGIFFLFICTLLFTAYNHIVDFTSPNQPNWFKFIMTIGFQVGIAIILGIFTILILEFTIPSFDFKFKFIITTSIILFASGIAQGHFKYKRVQKTLAYKNCSIEFENKIIQSNSMYYYIGKTHSNVFFYDVKRDIVTCYSMNEITKLDIGVN
ncbi:hypothetical protein LJ707_13400 [Mucilaginibacter sp. UR6-1]|uniref:hypothetical protein n=1 Tax=Mucilaginibacter sp. UR6-1 TaxID=1435643 RepID=UPI001E5ABA5D|nr:hypothetical protein [Mucilaginibacter sp. UR6-1]MCC8409928.1 hypothetical protein [Mucilaginibacter sp. UR6-1]